MDLKPAKLSSKKKRWGVRLDKKVIAAVIVGLLLAVGLWKFSSTYAVSDYVFGGGQSLPKSEEGRTNVLLLGIGGGRHEGATLTDTIMVASYDPKSHRVDLISLPRDLWVEKQKAKVNTLYQTGLAKGDEFNFVQEEIKDILGTEIPYTVRVDFGGFVKAIDLVGGIDVDVQTAFDDWEYPIEGKENELCGNKEEQIDVDEAKSKELNIPQGKQKVYILPDGKIATEAATLDLKCRFEHVKFEKGVTHMDGLTALKFVRSRHGTNDEGSDFARSKRQQFVIQAFRSKVLSLGTLTDPKKIYDLLVTFGNSISTNIPENKYLSFINAFQKVDKITSHVIDLSSAEKLLIHPDPKDYGGGWVLIPPKNDYTKIHQYVDDILAGRPTSTPSASATASPTPSPKK